MSKRRKRRIHVRLDEHAEMRWQERARRPVGKLADLLAVLLIEQLGVGLQVRHGRAVLPLDAYDLRLPYDLVAYIDPPNIRGVWRIVTFKPIKRKEA